MIIKEGQITMDPIKLAGIQDWPTPTTVKHVKASVWTSLYKVTSLRVFKEFLRFWVNACIDSTKGKNRLRNYCTEIVGLYTQREI